MIRQETIKRTYELEVSWKGILISQLKGLYISNYEEGGEAKRLVSSQMQVKYRRLFEAFLKLINVFMWILDGL